VTGGVHRPFEMLLPQVFHSGFMLDTAERPASENGLLVYFATGQGALSRRE